jgi:hypothetical protein
MTDSLANVVIPYLRFLEYQDRRRRRLAAEAMQRDPPPTIDADVAPWVQTASPHTLNERQF